jgi:Polyketide cyclase / dehydrase and lipid transport
MLQKLREDIMLSAIVFIAIVVIAILLYASSRPSTFSLTRGADLRASPEKVFAQINNFKNWAAWSPWEEMDPNMQRNFSGAASGVGAKYSWVGNKKVGEGNMEITRSVASSNMQLDLHFLKPFKADNVTEFKLTPISGGTHIDWEMRGPLGLMMKLMHMFMDMDSMVGKDFEKGLEKLKVIVER